MARGRVPRDSARRAVRRADAGEHSLSKPRSIVRSPPSPQSLPPLPPLPPPPGQTRKSPLGGQRQNSSVSDYVSSSDLLSAYFRSLSPPLPPPPPPLPPPAPSEEELEAAFQLQLRREVHDREAFEAAATTARLQRRQVSRDPKRELLPEHSEAYEAAFAAETRQLEVRRYALHCIQRTGTPAYVRALDAHTSSGGLTLWRP